jgi:hypothetical protein
MFPAEKYPVDDNVIPEKIEFPLTIYPDPFALNTKLALVPVVDIVVLLKLILLIVVIPLIPTYLAPDTKIPVSYTHLTLPTSP